MKQNIAHYPIIALGIINTATHLDGLKFSTLTSAADGGWVR